MRLGFACPYYGAHAPSVTASQLSAMAHAAWQHQWVRILWTDRMPHVKACEQILDRAVRDEKVEALFWTEHDCLPPSNAVSKLVKVLEENPDCDVATGITFMRYAPYYPMIAVYGGILTEEIAREERVLFLSDEDKDSAIGQSHYRFVTKIDTRAAPYAVDAASMNCLLFRRSALEAMAEIPHPFDAGHHTTPDFMLFDRLRGKAKLMVDPSLLTIHLGDSEHITVDTWIAAMKDLVKLGEAKELPMEAPAEAGR